MFLKKLNFDLLKIRIFKVIFILKNPYFLPLAINGIFPNIEHLDAISNINESPTLIDCGSNKGQFFSLFFFKKKISHLVCFDPFVKADYALNYLINNNINVYFFNKGLSYKTGILPFYIAKRHDSSSLKRIKNDSGNYFRDVIFENLINVEVKKLNDYEDLIINLPRPITIKIDVQGAELDLLLGATKVIKYIKYIIVEINFKQIYEIDSDPSEIINFLFKNGFQYIFKYNKNEVNGEIISYDYLFTKNII